MHDIDYNNGLLPEG